MLSSWTARWPRVGDAGHGEAEVAIVEQDLIAGLHVLGQHRVRGGDAALVAEDGLGGDRELGAEPELHLAGLELAGPDLGALQIEEHGDRSAAALGLGAHDPEHLGVIFVGAVGEVEARHAHAGFDELADTFRSRGGGAEGADDLRAGHLARE